MKQMLFVFLGGGLGAMIRYVFSKYIFTLHTNFPWATLTANILGCFSLGFIMGYCIKMDYLKTDAALFFTVGFCGGLTTFSTFAFENFKLISEGQLFSFFLNTILSLVLGIGMLILGYYISR